LILLAVFLGWRFLRPMNIFDVSEAFERPIPTDQAPAMFTTLSAQECAACHREFVEEWTTSIHSQAWTDPYFQVDWRFDRKQQICKNCHTPLQRQQEHLVLGFRDQDKWDPILEPNPAFDPALQHEGITCGVCHFRDGFILGPYGDTAAPHPVRKMENPNQVCLRCHLVTATRWDVFYRLPPCGTVAEIRAAHGTNRPASSGESGELVVDDLADIDCVGCHMPLAARAVVDGGVARPVRRHLWRGGHDPAMVKSGLTITLEHAPMTAARTRRVTLTIANVGAAHYLPTGTPDRHLTVDLRLLDRDDRVVKAARHTLKRTVMWRPFIVDLWDTRLRPGEERRYGFDYRSEAGRAPYAVEAVVRYHLLDERRRKRIGYENTEPIAYEVFRERRPLDTLASREGGRQPSPRGDVPK
jgi:hypothetical protein